MSALAPLEIAKTTLGDVVAKLPGASPEQLLAELTETTETLFALETISCVRVSEWTRNVWRQVARDLARQRRRDLGLPVCTRSDGCPNAATLKPLVSVLVYQCDRCSLVPAPDAAEISEEYVYGGES